MADGLLRVRMTRGMANMRHCWNTHHVSTGYEMHLLLNGAARLSIEGREQTLRAWHGVLIAPGVAHISASENEQIDHFYLHFDAEGEKLQETLRSILPCCAVIAAKQDVMLLAHDILERIRDRELYSREILGELMQQIVLLILRQANIVLRTEVISLKKNERQERRNLVEEFFLEGLPYGTERKELAVLLQLSERQTLRFLMDNYGMTFDEKLRHFRMEHSAWLLRETDRTMQEIAASLRFEHLSSFYKAFRKWYGMTPGEYRKEKTLKMSNRDRFVKGRHAGKLWKKRRNHIIKIHSISTDPYPSLPTNRCHREASAHTGCGDP